MKRPLADKCSPSSIYVICTITFLILVVGLVQMSAQAPRAKFASPVTYKFGGNSVAIADVNGDGKLDVVVANNSHSTVDVLLGNGDGTLQFPVSYSSVNPYCVAVADVNGDGRPDMVVANYSSDSVGVLLGNGDGTFQNSVSYGSGGSRPWFVAVGDVNGDNHPDIIAANFDFLGVLLGNGDGSFKGAVSYSSGGSWLHSVAIADINSDSHPDLIAANYLDNTVGVLLGNGDGTFQSAVNYSSGGTGPSSVAIADTNRDGKVDLVVANFMTVYVFPGLVGVLLGNGDGTFQRAVSYAGGYMHRSIATADVNGDGFADAIVADNECGRSCSGGKVDVLLGNGDGTFQALYRYTSGSSSNSVAVGDLNHDGKPDLVVANFLDYVSVLLNVTAYRTGAILTSSLNPSQVGQSVTFKVTVTSEYGTPPDGDLVTFYDGTAIIAAVPLVGGTAVYATSSLSAKSHTIKASYPGHVYYAQTSGKLIQVVNKYSTTTILNAYPNPSDYGQSVIFRATVTPSGPYSLAGFVKFWDGPSAIGTAPVSAGVATLKRSTLAVGTHPITAKYLSDAYNAASTSSLMNQVVE